MPSERLAPEVGAAVGLLVGDCVGDAVGAVVGLDVGLAVIGAAVATGATTGALVGTTARALGTTGAAVAHDAVAQMAAKRVTGALPPERQAGLAVLS
jgi:hypothetical protein